MLVPSVQRWPDPPVQGLHGDERGRALRRRQPLPLRGRGGPQRALVPLARVPRQAPGKTPVPPSPYDTRLGFLLVSAQMMMIMIVST